MPAALPLLLAAALGATPFFEDDFETGTLLQSSTPSGRWQNLIVPRASVSAAGPAAHRGAYGLRVNDRDSGDGGSEVGQQGGVTTQLPQAFDESIYIRVWLRIDQDVARPGRTHLMTMGTASSSLTLFMSLTEPNSGLELGGDSADGTRTDPVRNVVDGGWHLMEVGLEGLATPRANRFFWLDGNLVAHQDDVDLVGADAGTWYPRRINLGEPWSYVIPSTGLFDYDDFRLTRTPPASRVALSAPQTLVAGQCNPLSVVFRQSADGGVVETHEPVDVRLSTDGGTFHADPQCQVAASGLFVDGGTGGTVYLRPARVGAFGARAADVSGDLLPGPTRLTAYALAAQILAPERSPAGEAVTLDGSGSRAQPGASITEYRWRQLEGPTFVELGATASVNFTASEPGLYGFELIVGDGTSLSPPATASVLIEGDRPRPPERLGGCYCGAVGFDASVAFAALALLAAASRARTRP